MPERDGYIPGVPCWVDTSQPDPESALDFYSGLFGWEFEDVMPPGSEGKYFLARLHGGLVGAVGGIPEGAPPMAVWNTYVWVESADDTASKVRDAGGNVLMEPFDVMDAGRMAVFAIPRAPCSASGRRRRTAARRSSTSTARWTSTASTPATRRPRRPSTARCSAGRRWRSAAAPRCGRCRATATTSSATTRTCASRSPRWAARPGSRTSSPASTRSPTTSPTRRRTGT